MVFDELFKHKIKRDVLVPQLLLYDIFWDKIRLLMHDFKRGEIIASCLEHHGEVNLQ
jgi:hypothetical protein